MLKNNWQETKILRPGNVLVWQEKKYNNGEFHSHLGFYLDKDKAISHNSRKKIPVAHHFTYGRTKKGKPKRKIIMILTHPIIKNG